MNRYRDQIDQEDMEKRIKRVEAIINSMTKGERANPKTINASRRKRIAAGSGVQVRDVNEVLKQFADMQELMKQARKGKFPGMPGGKMPGGKFPGGRLPR
jgi:signal recognition particle subunit SRP54